MMEKEGFDHDEVHCTAQDTEKCESVREINLTTIKDLDVGWARYSVDFIKRM